MFKLFSRKKDSVHSSMAEAPDTTTLRLAHDDRDVIHETDDAERLARIMLADAELEYKAKRPGFSTVIIVPTGHESVHHLELLLQMMNIDHEYGFRTGTMFDNEVHLTKL